MSVKLGRHKADAHLQAEQFLRGTRKASLQVKESLQDPWADNNAASQNRSSIGFV